VAKSILNFVVKGYPFILGSGIEVTQKNYISLRRVMRYVLVEIEE